MTLLSERGSPDGLLVQRQCLRSKRLTASVWQAEHEPPALAGTVHGEGCDRQSLLLWLQVDFRPIEGMYMCAISDHTRNRTLRRIGICELSA